MRDLESVRQTRSRDAPRVAANGVAGGPMYTAKDRRYLLRRASRFPFPELQEEADGIRIRKGRRVNGPFSAIPPLSRNGRY